MKVQRGADLRRLALAGGLAVLCSACTAPTASYEAACEGRGDKPGTAAFDDCMRQQDAARYGDRRRVVPPGYSAPASW